MNWKEFFKPTKSKFLFLLFLLIITIFFGFFNMSNCFVDENGKEICRNCGLEGIFNPLLRPISFLISNVFRGLIESGNLQICGANLTLYLLFPLDLIYQYFISCTIIYFYNKSKKQKIIKKEI